MNGYSLLSGEITMIKISTLKYESGSAFRDVNELRPEDLFQKMIRRT